MKIAQIEALPGQKAFGFVKATETHGGFDVHFPLHIVAGRRPGPTLLVVAGMSGLEIEPALILPQVVAEIDPEELQGTLLVVPLFNTSGFEFEQVNAIWDDKALHAVGAWGGGRYGERAVAALLLRRGRQASGRCDRHPHGCVVGLLPLCGGVRDRRRGARAGVGGGVGAAARGAGRAGGRVVRLGGGGGRESGGDVRGSAVGRGCGTTGRKTCSGCGTRW